MTITQTHIRSVDLNLLTIMAALYSTGSVSKAAEKIGMTQPAVSRSLQRLRAHFSDPLFVRGQGGMMPTDRAMAMKPLFDDFFKSAEVLLNQTPFDPKTAQGEFVIASSDYMETVLLPRLLHELRQRAPGIGVRLVSLTDKKWRDLEHRKTDVVIVVQQNMPENIKQRLLFTDEFVCIAAKNNPHTQNGLDVETYGRLPHVQVKISPRTKQFTSPIDMLLAKQGITRRVEASISTLFSAARIVAQTDLIATMPRRVVEVDAQLLPIQIFPCPIDLHPTRVAIGWHPRSHDDPAHKFLRSLIVKIAH